MLRFPNQRAGHWLSINIPAAEARAPFVLDDVVDEADGEVAALAHVDEQLDAGGEHGIGAVDAAAKRRGCQAGTTAGQEGVVKGYAEGGLSPDDEVSR